MTTTRVLALAALAGLFALSGCGGGKPPEQAKAKVSGTITLDKQPLKTGRITFDAVNGQPPSEFDILDGKFEGNAPVGQCKVMITSVEKMTMKEKLRKDGQKVIEGPGYDDMVEVNLLPDRYNIKSEIKREVEAGKTNEFKFELQSK
jgi:hypothetical protein